MAISKETLRNLFGIDNADEIVKQKSEQVERARPLAPKVKRVQMSAEECQELCKGIGLEYLEGYEGRVLEYVITDETVDRYGDVVRASGGDFTNYRKNPVVLAFHNGKALPVGNALKTWHDDTRANVKQWVLFLDDRVDRTGMAETAYRFASSGAMKTGSIGFIPRDGGIRRPDEQERKKMRMPSHGVIYESWELLEFSVTPVPANPNASMKELADVIHRGLYCPENIVAARGVFSDVELTTAGTLLKDEVTAALEIMCEQPPEGYEKDITEFYAETREISEEDANCGNEHICKLTPVGLYDKFRFCESEHEGKKIGIVLGRMKDQSKWERHLYCYNKDAWTEAESRSHSYLLGEFTPATIKSAQEVVERIVEYRMSFNKELTDLLTTLATRMNLLIEKLDMNASASERTVETLRMLVSARVEPVAHNHDSSPGDLCSEDELAKALEEAAQGL